MSAIGHNIVLQDLPADICIIRQVDLWDNERSDNSKRCCCGPDTTGNWKAAGAVKSFRET